jgi:hypothetical protein
MVGDLRAVSVCQFMKKTKTEHWLSRLATINLTGTDSFRMRVLANDAKRFFG